MRSKAAYLLTVFVVVLAPLPFGSVELGWMALWSAILAAGLAFASFQDLTSERLRILGSILTAAVIYGGGIWLQSITDLGLVQPHPVWRQASTVLDAAHPGRVTVSAGGPWLALGNPLLMLLAFVCAFLIAADRQRAHSLLKAVAYSGTAYAVYGLAGLLFAPASLLWTERTAYVGSLSGTFVNRNVAATYFGTCSILWLMFLLAEIKRSPLLIAQVRWPTLLRALPALEPRLWQAALGLMLCVAATFLTASRAGILLTIVALTITFALALFRMFPRGALSAVALAGIAVVAGLFIELWGGTLAVRLAYNGLFDETRWQVYRASLAMILDSPLLGSGLGTFSEVFPAYRPAELVGAAFWNRAHNTPLEMAVEVGVPITVVLLALWVYLFVKLVRGVWSRQRGVIFPIAGTAVGLLGSIHSLVDFPLQIPGYSIVFAAIIGCSVSQAQSDRLARSP